MSFLLKTFVRNNERLIIDMAFWAMMLTALSVAFWQWIDEEIQDRPQESGQAMSLPATMSASGVIETYPVRAVTVTSPVPLAVASRYTWPD